MAAVAVPAAGERRRLAYLTAVAGMLGGYLALQLWDVFHYSWLRGYDAWASWLYTNQILTHHDLPGAAQSDVWHNPPLFYAVSAVLQSHVLQSVFGWTEPDSFRVVQLMSVAAGFGVVVLSFGIARQLFPRSWWIQLGTLAFAATVPVLLRGSLMYHPEPLAAVLATAAVYVAIRASSRGWGVRRGAAVGLLLGLANLTRAWALADAVVLVAVCLLLWSRTRRPEVLRFAAATAAVFAVLVAPWYLHQEITHGNPLAFSKPDPTQWTKSGRPVSFFTALDLHFVFTNPYVPNYRNDLLPVVYTDWWGDYARYFHVPATETYAPDVLSDDYRRPLVYQSLVGLLPTALALAGAVGLAIVSFRRRRIDSALLLVTAAAVLAAFVSFLVEYPKVDGDNIKAMYVIDLVPAFAVCAAWALDRVRRVNRLVLAGVLVWLAATAYLDVAFMVLT